MAETNIPSIAASVFGAPPKPAGSVMLGLEDCAPPNSSDEEKTQILSEILMLMFLEGIKVRYGADKKPENLSPQQIRALSDYVRSYGFYVLVRTDALTEPPPVPSTSSDQRKKELKDFHERFYDFDRELWHEVAFDFAPIANEVMPQAGHNMTHREI